MSTDTSIPLEDMGKMPMPPENDRRPRIPEPLPVRLVTVDDARLIAGAGLESALDNFYVDLLGFERDQDDSAVVYHAENFRLIFEVIEPPVVRVDMRTLGIEVLLLREAELKLIDAKIEFVWQKGLSPGQESLLLQDPAGNWIELVATPPIR